MAINKDETGVIIFVDMGEDVSTNIGLEIILQPEIGEDKSRLQADGVSVGTVNVTDGDVDLLANQYLQYTTQEDDLDFAGTWRKKGLVKIDTSKTLISNFEQFVVLA